MTRYDGVRLPDGTLHPLSQVPEYVLDAAKKSLEDALEIEYGISRSDDAVESIAHAVLAAAREATPARAPVPASVQATMVIIAVEEWYREFWGPHAMPIMLREAMSTGILRAEEGWFPFGTHADVDTVMLDFSTETGEDGMPLYERPRLG